MFCKNWGNKIDDDARFCKKCGAKIGNNENTNKDDSLYVVHEFHYSNYGNEHEERMRAKRNSKILKFKITLFVILGMIALVIFLIWLFR